MSRITVEEFFMKVDIKEPDECWEWKGERNKQGQGVIYQNGGYYSVSWLCWKLTQEKSSKGFYIKRSCGNKLCVNPAHLYLDEAPTKKLTGEHARMIRQLYRDNKPTLKNLAESFGVSEITIRNILIEKTWKGFYPPGPPVEYRPR